MTVDIHSSTAAVPEVKNENSLNENCQVKSKVGHVAKFQCDNDDQISNDEELYPKSSSDIFQISFQQFKQIPEFIPLTKQVISRLFCCIQKVNTLLELVCLHDNF